MRKNLWKKFAAAACVLGLTAAVFTGCGNTPASGDGTDTTKADAQTKADNDNASDFDASKEITVISREDGSGTRGAFIEIVGVEQADADGNKVDCTTDEAIISNSTNEVLTTVAQDTYAIGYISLGSLNDTVKALTVDGVAATAENVADGSYAVQRPFNIATLGEASEDAQDFINFIMSADGQAIVEANGYITVSDAAAYESNGASGSIVVGGSSSVSPLMEKLIEAYSAVGGVTVDLQTSDSSTGMQNAANGTYDIGMASREIKESELANGLVGTVIAQDGIAVIVNKENPTDGLSVEQIMNIYVGEVTTWDEVQ